MITFSYSLQQLLAQRLITHQAVSTRTLPAILLEIPNCSSIRITRGFARASDLCDIYTTITLPCRSQHDWWNCVLWYVMRETMHEKRLKAEAIPFSTPLAHKRKIQRNQTRIHNSQRLYSCYENKTSTHDWQLSSVKSYKLSPAAHKHTVSSFFLLFLCCIAGLTLK